MASDLRDRLIAEFRWTDPGPASDVLVSDRSGWWRDPGILHELGPALGALFASEQPTVVVAPEVTGFLIGPLVARALGVGGQTVKNHLTTLMRKTGAANRTQAAVAALGRGWIAPPADPAGTSVAESEATTAW